SLNTLKIAGAFAFTQATSSTLTVNGIIKTGANVTLGASAVSGATISNNNAELVVNTPGASDALTLTSQITGTGGLTKTGLGTLTLGNTTATGQFTGATTINQGTLAFAA